MSNQLSSDDIRKALERGESQLEIQRIINIVATRPPEPLMLTPGPKMMVNAMLRGIAEKSSPDWVN